MPSEIKVAGFPVPSKYGSGEDVRGASDGPALDRYLRKRFEASEKHRLLLARAINQLAEQAFTPVTTETTTATVYTANALNVDVPMAALTQTITVPVRSKLHILGQAPLNSSVYVLGMSAQLRINVNGAALAANTATWGATFALPFSVQGVFSPAEPGTVYTVELIIRLTGTGGGAPTVVNLGQVLANRLAVRVEPFPYAADT